MMKVLLIALGLLISFGTTAQIASDTLVNGVVVVKDTRLDALISKKAEINKKAADLKKASKGYRIQVLNTTDRNQALNAKSKLLSLYPEHKSYLMYQAPYFKLRIGNFIDRKEADDLKKQLSRMFPTGVFVIPSEIEPKMEKEDSK